MLGGVGRVGVRGFLGGRFFWFGFFGILIVWVIKFLGVLLWVADRFLIFSRGYEERLGGGCYIGDRDYVFLCGEGGDVDFW